jgi:hypothetical protein
MSFYSDASLVLIPSGYKDQKVYSAVPTDGSGDLVFSRASSATRVASNGLIEKVRTNLALYSEQFNDASWLKGTLTVSANAGTAPNGTTTADLIYPSSSTSNCVIFNGITITSGLEYTNSVYVKASGKTWTFIRGINDGVGAWFNLSTGVVGSVQSGVTATITSIGSGWYRCSVTQTSTSTTGRLVILIVDGDGSTAVTANGTDGLLIWGGQQETGVMTDYIATTSAAVSVGPVSGLPRLDYLNSTCPRLLLEPQRSSLVLYSEQMDNAAWNKNNLTITANNLVSPDGYTNADTALETATNAFHDLIQSPSLTSGTTYTLSSFVKAAGRDYCYLFLSDGTTPAAVKFNLATGVILGTATGSPVSSKIENYGNGWYRCSMVYTSGATATGTLAISATNSPALSLSAYAGDITKGIAVYGAQLEAGAYATSYIPTLGTSVTRVWDDASKTGITSLIGQTAGTLFVELNADGRSNATARVIAYLTANGSTDNRVAIQYNASGQIQAIASSGGSTQGSVVYTITGPCKAAFAYNSSGYELFVNGVSRGTFTGSLPTSLTRLDMNSLAGTFDELGGTINQVLIFKTRLSNSDLATLTTL